MFHYFGTLAPDWFVPVVDHTFLYTGTLNQILNPTGWISSTWSSMNTLMGIEAFILFPYEIVF